MASRWMQQKLRKMGAHRKQARMKRAYLKGKTFSYDPMSPYSLRSRGTKELDLATSTPESEITVVNDGELTMAKAEGLGRAIMFKEWQTLRMQGVTKFHRIHLTGFKGYILELYWSGDTFYFFEEDQFQGYQRRSIPYRSATWRRAYDNNQIRWDATLFIPKRTS